MKSVIFSADVAMECGVNAAILFQNIAYWCETNKAKGQNFKDNRYWTFSSIKAFTELLPFMSDSVVKTAISKLEEKGLIVEGEYNKLPYDRTKWYALTDLGEEYYSFRYSSSKKSLMGMQEIANGDVKNRQPIPDINTNINTDNKQYSFEDFWKEYPKKVGKGQAEKAFNKVCKNEVDFAAIMHGLSEQNRLKFQPMIDDGQEQYIPYPSTWLNGRRWEDKVTPYKEQKGEKSFFDFI